MRRLANDKLERTLLMSHQTGITTSTLSAQTIVLTPYIMFEINNHAMMESVETLRARQCHGKGTRTRTAATKAPMGNSRCIMIKERVRDTREGAGVQM